MGLYLPSKSGGKENRTHGKGSEEREGDGGSGGRGGLGEDTSNRTPSDKFGSPLLEITWRAGEDGWRSRGQISGIRRRGRSTKEGKLKRESAGRTTKKERLARVWLVNPGKSP